MLVKHRLAAFTLTSAALLALLCLPNLSAAEQGLAPRVRALWSQIGKSKSQCSAFDYFPDGGIQNFYCHASHFVDYQHLQDSLGEKAFLKGPHGRSKLVLSDPADFGYYNPDFVHKLKEALIPAAQDPSFRQLTQKVYDKSVAPLARIAYVTYHKLHHNPVWLAGAQKQLLTLMNHNELPNDYYEKYFYFMNPKFFQHENERDYLMGKGFDGGWNGNVVKTTVGFWIRRSIDGSDSEFYQGLEALLQTYDPAFLRTGRIPSKHG